MQPQARCLERWPPTLLFDRRAYGSKEFESHAAKDFCNTIRLTADLLGSRTLSIGCRSTALIADGSVGRWRCVSSYSGEPLGDFST